MFIIDYEKNEIYEIDRLSDSIELRDYLSQQYNFNHKDLYNTYDIIEFIVRKGSIEENISKYEYIHDMICDLGLTEDEITSLIDDLIEDTEYECIEKTRLEDVIDVIEEMYKDNKINIKDYNKLKEIGGY